MTAQTEEPKQHDCRICPKLKALIAVFEEYCDLTEGRYWSPAEILAIRLKIKQKISEVLSTPHDWEQRLLIFALPTLQAAVS